MSRKSFEEQPSVDTAIFRIADSSTKEHEYWTHVSSQEELPKAKGIDTNPILSALQGLLDDFPRDSNSEVIVSFIARQLVSTPSLIHELRPLIGVSDKRLYLDLSYIFSRTYHPAKNGTLCGCLPHNLTRHSTVFFENALRAEGASASAKVIAAYLVNKGLGEMLQSYSSMSEDQRKIIVSNLITPKEAQQNEAKRRGHGAEAAFAELLEFVGCNTFVPKDKVANPMGSRDPNVNPETFVITAREAASTLSFDLVILDAQGLVSVCVQGLIQSSDPGQFGVDKSNQTVLIRRRINEFNERSSRNVELWGIVDGVGYSENKEGTINKMLREFHEFIQIKSLYKAALGLHRLGLCSLKAIQFHYPPQIEAQMMRYVPKGVAVLSTDGIVKPAWRAMNAGHATIFV